MAIPWGRLFGGIGILISLMLAIWWASDKVKIDSQSKDHFPVLTTVDPVKVGHVREIQLVSGQMHKMKTLSMRPPLFEIEDFLSDEECDDIIFMAQTQGLENSQTFFSNIDQKNNNTQEELLSKPEEVFKNLDANNNGVIEKAELAAGMSYLGDLLVTDESINKMMVELDLDTDKNGELSYEEYTSIVQQGNLQKILNYTNKMKKDAPNLRARVSDTAFLSPLEHVGMKKLFENLRKRIQLITGLPKDIIWTSEDLQVVKYDKNGHYHCHLDSVEEKEQPNVSCCHNSNWPDEKCVPCRFVTFFYYLNEPEEGGETAFPIADNDTTAIEQIRGEKHYLCDLSNHCHKAKIAYKPKKGTALFWYNHKVNQKTGWLGDLDRMSFHGGCDVIRGTKWAANNWLNVGRDRKMDEEAWVAYKQNVEDYDKPQGKTKSQINPKETAESRPPLKDKNN